MEVFKSTVQMQCGHTLQTMGNGTKNPSPMWRCGMRHVGGVLYMNFLSQDKCGPTSLGFYKTCILFRRHGSGCWPPATEQALKLLEYISRNPTEVFVKCWQFLLYCLTLPVKNMHGHTSAVLTNYIIASGLIYSKGQNWFLHKTRAIWFLHTRSNYTLRRCKGNLTNCMGDFHNTGICYFGSLRS